MLSSLDATVTKGEIANKIRGRWRDVVLSDSSVSDERIRLGIHHCPQKKSNTGASSRSA
jgi:hypothetical protein